MAYVCACCGKVHDSLPDFGFDAPSYVSGVPDAEREERVRLTSDLCSIDKTDYFIRSVLSIKLTDADSYFGLGLWVSQAKKNFDCYVQNFDTSEIGPFFGWISNSISYKGKGILSLEAMAHFQGNGQRPLLELRESDHPLYLDYLNGISLAEAWELAHSFMGDRL